MRLRLSQHSLPWFFSVLLHAAIFLLIRWGAVVPLYPYGHGAMEVMLVGGVPGGGQAPGPGTEGHLSRDTSGPGSVAKPSMEEASHSSDGQKEASKTDAPVLRDFVPQEDISPPGRARKEEEGKVEQKDPVVSRLSPLQKALPRWTPRDPPERPRTSAFNEPLGLGDGSGEITLLSRGSNGGGGIGPGAGEGTEGDSGVARAGDGKGVGTGFGLGSGNGSGGGGMDWFRLLRDKIERAKQYPPRARRWGMEGTAEVQFRIARDGSVQEVTVVKSSGFPILDRATVETLKRAAPLPVIPGTIRIPISYRLRER